MLRDIIVEMVQKTANASRPIEQWELRTEAGQMISDLSRAVGTYGFAHAAVIAKRHRGSDVESARGVTPI